MGEPKKEASSWHRLRQEFDSLYGEWPAAGPKRRVHVDNLSTKVAQSRML
jgi:hypothetical protein